jgi:hypothetical protein
LPVKLPSQILISLSYAGISARLAIVLFRFKGFFLRPTLGRPPLANGLYYSFLVPAVKYILARISRAQFVINEQDFYSIGPMETAQAY